MGPFFVRLTVIVVGWSIAATGSLSARNPHRGFELFATSVNVLLTGNRVRCHISNVGELCVDPTNSPSLGGGFWPAGTTDQYIFNQGLQFAAIIAGNDLPGFAWPGDTVGAFFFDPRGDQAHGAALSPIFDSRSPRDRLTWPSAARTNDPDVFAALLRGRDAASDQDTWVRFWDGNTRLSNGRAHPAGLVVDQRTLAWNGQGLRDVIFFVYRIINVSARSAATYQRLAAVGYEPDAIAQIAAIGERFHQAIEDNFAIQIPDTGYTMRDAYVAFAQDADVGQAGSNYSNGNLVFNTTFAYKSDFRELSWQYPGDAFGPPFAAAPGYVAEAVLRGPPDTTIARAPLGITFMGNITGGAPFPDAVGVARLWRNISGNLLATDGSCSFAAAIAKARRFCFMTQTAADTRVFMASGPSNLDPGRALLFIVAQVQAAPVDSAVRPFIGGNVVPGFPVAGDRLAQGTDTLRNVDRIAGWRSHTDANGNGRIDPEEVQTVPMSLYWKVQQAQAALAAGFVQPTAPASPQMLVVPGDGRATVVWQKSASEAAGDPYFPIAANPASPLYDPDYRQYDVEGYRVWRGRSPGDMQVVAQFDYRGTQISDYTGQVFSGEGALTCVPELGITTTCGTLPRSMDLSGHIVQYRLGDRNVLQNGGVVVLRADTASPRGAAGRVPLGNTGVPFVFVDEQVTNGVTYYYAVTAFDVNSIRSGPSLLESTLQVRTATPRIASGRETVGSVAAARLMDRNGNTLAVGPLPTLNATTAIFSGPMPPTNALSAAFLGFVPELVPDGTLTLTIDSVVPGSWFNGSAPAVYWVTARGGGAPARFAVSVLGASTSRSFDDIVGTAPFPATLLGATQSGRFGGDSTYALYGTASVRINGDYRYTSQWRAAVNGDPAGFSAGPRWWAGAANENVNDPNGINCLNTPAGFSCPLADLSRNAGQIAGVGILNIASYGTIGTTEPIRTIEGITSGVFRAADFRWYWGLNGAVDSVVDVTHNVAVPFSPKIRASWGILTDSSFTRTIDKSLTPDTSITRLTWGDAACIAPAPRFAASCGGAANFAAPDSGAFLMNHARLSPVNFASSTFTGLTAFPAVAATGNGFILYLDGHFFLMQMATLPAQGTVWNMRTYAGNITGAAGNYVFVSATRPAAVPGLRLELAFSGAAVDSSISSASLLARVHTVPDPYYLTNSLETATTQVLRFVNLPDRAVIRIYSLSGILIRMLTHNDPTGGSEEAWDLRTRNGRSIATGVYLYHVEGPDGASRVGRFTVVNRAY